ncbi:hypothetical protein H5410_056077 [Solanum commersonii]|uniref:Uncharacterized protein n=1 Tax=Solanum commersonii TaxID=4109 RepID=A0A9J5WL22_SOLCO|nr:hypothetical protein H5410_056077 [Solanum commersonii]
MLDILGGHNSMLMAPKLEEMDEVIKTIDLNSLPTNNNDQGRALLVCASIFLQELCSLVNKLAVIRDILDLEAFPCYRYEVVTTNK